MFWDDIKDIKAAVRSICGSIQTICSRLLALEAKCQVINQGQERAFSYLSDRLEEVDRLDEIDEKIEFTNSLIQTHAEITRDHLEEFFFAYNSGSSINKMHEKLDCLLEDVDRLSDTINEFKANISIAIAEKKEHFCENQEKKSLNRTKAAKKKAATKHLVF